MSVSPRYLVADFPEWSLTAAGRCFEEAVAIVERGRVIACTELAREAGVRPRQPRKEAESRCEELTVLVRDRALELRAFERVLSALAPFGVTPAVRRAGWLGFGTRGPARRLGGEQVLAEEVRAALSEVIGAAPFSPGRREAFCVGIANGPFAATLAAGAGLVVPARETARFLSPYRVESLGRPRLAEVLHRLGVHTLGDFALLGEAEVLTRFGEDGAHARALAAGEAVSPLLARKVQAEYAVFQRYDEPLEDVAAVALASRALAQELCSALEHDARSCSIIVVEAKTTEGEHLVQRWSHDGPWSAPLVVERLRWQLDAWLRSERADAESGIPRGVEMLGLCAEEVADATGRQAGLFGPPPESAERAARVLARVQGMLGPDGVQRAVLVGGRDPKERVRLIPFGEAPPLAWRDAGLPWPGRLPAPTPATIFSSPSGGDLLDGHGAPLAVDGRGTLSGEPAVLALSERRLEIVAWSGPWPLDEQWWLGPARRRRARLQVVTADGTGWLLALERGSWLVEGRYD